MAKAHPLHSKATFSIMVGVGCQEKCEICLDLPIPFVHFLTECNSNQ
jgi:hypothetical protein